MGKHSSAFTLVEILIVVIILGVLAAMVIPQIASASSDARISVLRDNLRMVRTQVELYRTEHDGRAPGFPAAGGEPDMATFISQLTMATDRNGVTREPGTPGYIYGPYLERFPVNPLNGLSTVLILQQGDPDPEGGSDQDGWVYRPETLRFRADSSGCDNEKVEYFDY